MSTQGDRILPIWWSEASDDVGRALDYVRSRVGEIFSQVASDPYHGFSHARDVEQYAASLCSQAGIEASTPAALMILAAALLHDIGYTAYLPTWSQDRREHIEASIDIANEVLSDAPLFSRFVELSSIICYLIAHHDDTNYQYPSTVWQGRVEPVHLGKHAESLQAFEVSLSQDRREVVQGLLRILREADGLASTGDRGAERTFNYSRERGLPDFADGNPLNAWCWEESAIGNTRLAAKRALIDAITLEGAHMAREQYTAMERVVKSICDKRGVPYFSEILKDSTYRHESGAPLSGPGIKLQWYGGWESLRAVLREVTLLSDKNVHPYETAQMAPRRYSISELRPLSLYVLKDQLARQQDLQMRFVHDYALSMFDLTGIVEYSREGARFRMAPIVVERYYEPMESTNIAAIVDGLHRVWLARELGLKEIWVIEIRDVPEQFPLISLPVTWNSVKEVDSVPSVGEKRYFRYTSFESFPKALGFTRVPITPENYQYFFYRDLSPLGSGGIRGTHF